MFCKWTVLRSWFGVLSLAFRLLLISGSFFFYPMLWLPVFMEV